MMLLALLSFDLHAQEVFTDGNIPQFNVQNFRPALGRQDMLWVNETRVAHSKTFSFRNMFVYTKDPLSYQNYRGERVRILNDVLELDLLSSYSIGPFQIGLGIPLYLRTLNGLESSQSGIGDIWIDSKLQLSNREELPLGAALAVRGTLPTSAMNVGLGTEGIQFDAELDIDKRFGPTIVALNIGHRQQPTVELENVSWGPQFFTKLGMAYHVDERFGLSTELYAAFAYADFGNVASSPFEALFGAWRRFSLEDAWVIRGGLGMGLNEAISTPSARGILAISYEPAPVKDTDGDKVIDRKDACPQEAEDRDGIADEDGCPEPTKIVLKGVDQFGVEVQNFKWQFEGQVGNATDSFEAFGGTYALAAAAPGYKELLMEIDVPDTDLYEISLPMMAILSELRVVVQNQEEEELPSSIWTSVGKGMPSNIPGSRSARVRVGVGEVIVRAPGYRRKTVNVEVQEGVPNKALVTLEEARARIQEGRITIDGKVYFGQDSEQILDNSYDLLTEVSEVMQDHPELVLIRIEGHTDSLGDNQYNIQLSESRAKAVVDFLTQQGIAAERLKAVGFGEQRPIASNRSPVGRAQNRRVEFYVEKQVEPEEVDIDSIDVLDQSDENDSAPIEEVETPVTPQDATDTSTPEEAPPAPETDEEPDSAEESSTEEPEGEAPESEEAPVPSEEASAPSEEDSAPSEDAENPPENEPQD
ncbi:MAG: OmpA family protein [Myxococcota bacterium]|nr:OmpA family protein [Myxococcota bacterium]